MKHTITNIHRIVDEKTQDEPVNIPDMTEKQIFNYTKKLRDEFRQTFPHMDEREKINRVDLVCVYVEQPTN